MKRIVLALLATLLFAGCVTQTVDWQARVGHYTQDQAITDLGPPDKSAKLSDGTVVDEWLTQRSHVIVAPEPYFLPAGRLFRPGHTQLHRDLRAGLFSAADVRPRRQAQVVENNSPDKSASARADARA